jgi:flagellar motor switch protein FliG
MDFERLTGPEKSAVLVLSLPEDAVRGFLSRLADEEVERIMAAVSRLGEVPPHVQENVLREFRDALGSAEHAVLGGRSRALSLIRSALDESRSRQILEKLGRDEKRLDWTLRSFEPPYIAEVLAGEHPQTIALVLSQLPADRGAHVIAHLPEEQRPEVVIRLAELETVSNDLITLLEEGVAELFGRPMGAPTKVGGRDAAAKLLNRVPKSEGSAILEGVDGRDPDVAVEIRKRMLTFNDLISVDNRGFQTLLREISTEDLVVALKTASEEMKEKVFANVSSRAAEQIKEEAEYLPPMKLSEVEAIQGQVVEVARRLEEEGKLNIEGSGGEDVLV